MFSGLEIRIRSERISAMRKRMSALLKTLLVARDGDLCHAASIDAEHIMWTQRFEQCVVGTVPVSPRSWCIGRWQSWP